MSRIRRAIDWWYAQPKKDQINYIIAAIGGPIVIGLWVWITFWQ